MSNTLSNIPRLPPCCLAPCLAYNTAWTHMSTHKPSVLATEIIENVQHTIQALPGGGIPCSALKFLQTVGRIK